jgi:hypothetical protein
VNLLGAAQFTGFGRFSAQHKGLKTLSAGVALIFVNRHLFFPLLSKSLSLSGSKSKLTQGFLRVPRQPTAMWPFSVIVKN